MTTSTDTTTESAEASEALEERYAMERDVERVRHQEALFARQRRLDDKHWRAFLRSQSQAHFIDDALQILGNAVTGRTSVLELSGKLKVALVTLLAASDCGDSAPPRPGPKPAKSTYMARQGEGKGHEWVRIEVSHHRVGWSDHLGFCPEPSE